jgi:hypothetical protein
MVKTPGTSSAVQCPASAFDRARNGKRFGKLQLLHRDAFVIEEVCRDAAAAEALAREIAFKAKTHPHAADVCLETGKVVMQHVTDALCSGFARGVDRDFHGDWRAGSGRSVMQKGRL